jgi:hypothetical protein
LLRTSLLEDSLRLILGPSYGENVKVEHIYIKTNTMKKKVIRLNEQDIENLVRKIIKEDDMDWVKDDTYKPNLQDSHGSLSGTKYFKVGDESTYNNRPVTVVGVNGNFIKAKYNDDGNVFELPMTKLR